MTTHYLIKLILLLLAILQSIDLMANEKEIDFGKTLSVTQLLSAILNTNPQLDLAQAAWQASLARVKQQSTLEDAQFQYSFAPLTIDNQSSKFGQRFEISQKLPFPGKLQLRTKRAEFLAKSQQQNIAGIQLLLASSAKILFAEGYFIHQAIAIDTLIHSLLKEYRDIVITQYSTGRASKQEVLRAETELVMLKHQSHVLQRQKKTWLAQLNTLLNRPVNTPLPKPQPLIQLTQLPDLEQLQFKAMRFRPELKAISATINAKKTAADLTKLAYFPDLKLSAGYNSLWDNEDKRFNIAIGINIPLDQSKRQAADEEASANTQLANWEKKDLQAQIKQELAIIHAQTEESLHVLQLYHQQLLPLANQKLAAIKTDYQSGKANFGSLINSKIKRLQVKRQTEKALAVVHRHFAELEQAIGSIEPLSTAVEKGNLAK